METKRLLFLLCVLTSFGVNAEIYKWTDEYGQVHYGDKPAKEQSQVIDIPHQKERSKEQIELDQQRLENMKRWSGARQKERELKFQQETRLKQEKEIERQKCDQLKDELRDKERGGIVWYDLDEKGERRYLSDDEIDNYLEDLREAIRIGCR